MVFGLGLLLLLGETGAQFCHPAGNLFELFKVERPSGCCHRQVWPAGWRALTGASLGGFAGPGLWLPVLHAVALAQ